MLIFQFYKKNGKLDFELVQPKFLNAQAEQLGSGGSRVVAPMPGVLEKILVQPGDVVKKGDSLAVLIGEYIIRSLINLFSNFYLSILSSYENGAYFESPKGCYN